MIPMRPIRCACRSAAARLLLACTLVMAATAAQATLLLGNPTLGTGSTGTNDIGDLFKAAVSVNSATNQVVTGVTLRAKINSGAPVMVVDLFDDVAGSPGSSVLSFSTADVISSTFSLMNFTPDAAFQLNSGITYWLVATAVSSVTNVNEVALSTNSNLASGSASGSSSSFNFMCFGCISGVWDSASTTANDQHGFLIQSVLVPEPMTMTLLALGLAGIGFSRRMAT